MILLRNMIWWNARERILCFFFLEGKIVKDVNENESKECFGFE